MVVAKIKKVKDFLVLYFFVFIISIASLYFYRNINFNSELSSSNKSEGRYNEKNENKDSFDYDKTIKVGDITYYLIYEEISGRFLVFINFNNYIGYLKFKDGEGIEQINQDNFLERLVLES